MGAHILAHDLVGDGPNHVIVLHGWLGDRTSFDAIHQHLDRSAFSYAFVDCRGYGDSRELNGEFTVHEVAGDVLATADALGWSEFSLVGHSMGGIAAQAVLMASPERVNAIVGISPVPASGVPFDADNWRLFADAAEKPGNRRAIIDFTSGNRLPGAWLDAMVERSVNRSRPDALRRYLDSWANTDIHQRIEGSPLPVLVLAGRHDPSLSPEVMRQTWLRWYPKAELEELADAGHYAPDELPLALVAAMEGFLAR